MGILWPVGIKSAEFEFVAWEEEYGIWVIFRTSRAALPSKRRKWRAQAELSTSLNVIVGKIDCDNMTRVSYFSFFRSFFLSCLWGIQYFF